MIPGTQKIQFHVPDPSLVRTIVKKIMSRPRVAYFGLFSKHRNNYNGKTQPPNIHDMTHSSTYSYLKTVKLNLRSTVSRVRGFKGFTQLLIRTKLALNWCLAKSLKSMPFLRFFAWFWERATF